MWILKWVPDFVFYAIFLLGVAGVLASYFLKFISFVYMYRTPIQLVSIGAIIFGTYMAGAIANEEAWLAKVRELEAKVALAEEQAKTKNVEIQEKIVTKTQLVKEKGDDIIKYVDREVVKKEEIVKYVENCPVPKDIIELHNAAATLNKIVQEKK